MPGLAFGLNSKRPLVGAAKPTLKRKAVFNNDQDDNEDEDDNAFGKLANAGPKKQAALNNGPSRASSKVSDTQATNLSALRSAKLHDAAASQLDATVYDYDGVYDSFQAVKNKPATSDDPDKPRYMTSLLQSAEVRKRDQLRAKEKLLQRERENEGDEFADKEAFVTGAYKKQQEENRLLEEAEKKREEEEEDRRRKGGGMLEFNRKMLAREEERSKEMESALEEAKDKGLAGQKAAPEEQGIMDENKEAAELNEKGAKIVVNDDGEVVDKRQLLGAGLNVAPKKKIVDSTLAGKKSSDNKPAEWQRSTKAQDARLSQRERQSRMMERQIEEMTEKQRLAEEAEQKAVEEKNKSKLTDDAKMSAKERFMQRKREREEQAKKAKADG